MFRRLARPALFALAAATSLSPVLAADFKPVTDATLLAPDPADWLMISRTFDQQRFSPLAEINKGNVGDLRMAWSRGLSQGTQESTPLVYQGVMFAYDPGAGILALDAKTGDLLWQYRVLTALRT